MMVEGTYPTPRPRNIHPIHMYGKQNVIQILLQIIRAPQIPQCRRNTLPLRLKRLRKPKLADHDIRNPRKQFGGDMFQEPPHPRWRTVQPTHTRIRRRPNGEPVWRQTRAAGTVGEAWVATIAYAGVEAAGDLEGEKRAVGVDCVEVAGAFDHVFLVLCEVGQEVAERGLQGRWVVPVGPGPAEPANAEVEVALACFHVAGGGAVGFVVVAAIFEGDSVSAIELVVVPFGYFGVC